MILPWIVLALLYAGWYMRMTRSSVIDTMGEEFVARRGPRASPRLGSCSATSFAPV